MSIPRRATPRGPALALAALVSGCGGSKPPAAPAPDPAAAATKDAPAEAAAAAAGTAAAPSKAPAREPKEMLSTCSVKDSGLCLPDPAFVARLCDGSFPDAALVMFGGKSLFSRVYLKGDMEGWNADAGKSARAKLKFQEEVLVLKRRTAPKNGIVVGAGGGFLVMRWDGNCYTLDDGEVSTTRPASPKNAPIAWHLLEPATKDALLASPRVLAAFQKRGKECKGVTSGEVSKACEVADGALTAAVIDEVRKGIALPTPSKLP